MSDLISRQAAINAIDECYCGGEDSCGEPWIYQENAVEAIQMIEPILSAEPKRGRWIKLDMHRGMADHKCTACEQECYVPTCMGEPMYAYCPNCGAKMEVNNEIN